MAPSISIVQLVNHKIDLSKTKWKQYQSLVPKVLNKKWELTIKDANPAIANAIRRGFISEIPVKHLTISLNNKDIISTDPYIVNEMIRKRLEMIPIDQSIPDDSVFSLKFENLSDNVTDISSDDLKLNGSKTNLVFPGIQLCDINPGKALILNNITIKTSYGYNNARCSIGRVEYRIDEPHPDESELDKASAVSTPSKFKIILDLPGIYDGKEMFKLVISTLIDRLDAIDLTRNKDAFGTFSLTIPNESHSIGYLLSRYIYDLEPTIDYVASRTTHPSIREVVIDVRHPDAKTLIMTAIHKIKTDLTNIAK